MTRFKKWTPDNLRAKGYTDKGERQSEVSLFKGTGVYDIFIPYNVPSQKNSKRIAKPKVSAKDMITGNDQLKRKVISSEQVMRYKENAGPYYREKASNFRQLIEGEDLPIRMEFLFARKSRQAFDFNNINQAVLDMMVAAGWLPGDSMDELIPYPPYGPPYYIVDKDNPGVYIKVLKANGN